MTKTVDNVSWIALMCDGDFRSQFERVLPQTFTIEQALRDYESLSKEVKTDG